MENNKNGIEAETKQALLNNNTIKHNHVQENHQPVEKKKDKSKPVKKKKNSTWTDLARKGHLLWPYVWPSGKPALQLRVILSVIIIIATRGVNVLVPVFYKKIVNSLTPETPQNPELRSLSENTTSLQNLIQPVATMIASLSNSSLPPSSNNGIEYRWDYILIFIVLKSLHGGSGYLNCLRSFLWIRVAQNTQKKMRLKLFSHLHHLSVRWHLNRKTGEVIRVMDRGVQSINLILSHVLFNIFPVIADIIIAIVFFISVFNIWTGLIVFTTMLGYLIFTIVLSEWRTKYRRKMNDTDNQRNAASVDSILNFETVKLYSAEDWEVSRYEVQVDRHQEAEWWVNATANILNALQKTMMMLGLLGGSLLCAWYVYVGQFTVGDYVLFASYVEQLYGPLNMFGAYYRVLQQAFVDMEHMFEMLEEQVDIKDEPHAALLNVQAGGIQFDNVHFEYMENKPILRGINFTVPPGKTYALVGHSGGGKSTIIRLLFRFYDVKSGSIKIDGVDITKVTQKSLRQHIGVVPQDTVMFNQDLRFNIRYGRVDANDTEVEDSAKAADIHEKILQLPDGYSSKVGERGLKLSGGEKQRVAIARTILKGPEIVLLDEATSALDTRTERNIQQSLRRLCENKTTLIVAHRLSTVTHADKILVIEDGQIVESGTDRELRKLGGHYAAMWQEQLQSGEIDDETEQQPLFTLHNNDIPDPNYATIDNNDVISQHSNTGECICHCHSKGIGYTNNDELRTTFSSSSDDEIDIPVQRNLIDNDDDDNSMIKTSDGDSLKLVSSGTEFSLKPNNKAYSRLMSVPLHLSLPASKSFAEARQAIIPTVTRQRAYTQGDHNKILNRQVSLPAYKSREKEFKQKNEENEKAKERERERVNTLREDEEGLLNLLADDISTMEIAQDNDELIDPLCSSLNRARKLSDIKEHGHSKSDTVINMPSDSVFT